MFGVSAYFMVGGNMIKNKKLFIVAILILVAVFVVFMTFMLNDNKNLKAIGTLFVINAILAFISYLLLYKSLRKSGIIKRIFQIIVVICIFVLIAGVLFIVY